MTFAKRQRLELTWIGKDVRPKLEPRILLEDPAKSYHAKHRVTENDLFDNRLIFGDNLLALKALEVEFAGKVKCVFIDPPYNTGSAFTPELADGLQTNLDFATAHVALPEPLRLELDRQKSVVIGRIEQRNLALFSDETEKLDAWADDLKVGLEREIKELDRAIKECRTMGKGAATLAEKLEHQKEQRELESLRDKKRRELFTRQDEIQDKRDRLIDELEQQLAQQVAERTLLCCEWKMS